MAVIGVGYWGKKILSEYSLLSKSNQNVNLVGACDVFDDNLKFCKEKYDLPYLEKDPNDIFLNPEIDAVHICTPSLTHYDICREAMKNGKHVTVEKPMTLNSLEAIKLADFSHEKNVVLSVGHIFRFDAAIEKAKDLFESGWFGNLYWMKLTWTALMAPMAERDIITDLAPHPFDIMNFVTSDWPSKITCVARAHRSGQKEETAYIISEFKNNLMGNIELSWVNPDRKREVQIMGSKGFAKIDCVTQTMTAYENDNFYNLPVQKSNTISGELSHFVQCVNENRLLNHGFIHKNNALVGANVVRLLEVSQKSMRSGRSELVE